MEYKKVVWDSETVKLIRFLIRAPIHDHGKAGVNLSLLVLREFYEQHQDSFEKGLKIKAKLKRSEALVIMYWLSVPTIGENDWWALIERQRILDNLHNILYGQQTATMQGTTTQLLE
jgi:hypothetical protein